MRRPNVPYTSLYMFGAIIVMIAALLTGLAVALTTQTPQTRLAFPAIPTTGEEGTEGTTSTTSLPTTLPLTTLPPTTLPPTTVPPTTPPALAISCPPNVTRTLGAPLDPASTGGFAVGSGGCSTPVVQWSDGATFAARALPREGERFPARESSSVRVVEAAATRGRPVEGVREEWATTMEMHPRRSVRRNLPPSPAARALRSPSFGASNLAVVGTPFSVSNTGATPPDSTAGVSGTHVVMGVNTGDGALVVVTTKNTTHVASFMMNTLGAGNCSAPTEGDPQILWDHAAQRWVLLELGRANHLCVYVSDGSDPLGGYAAFRYDFSPHFPDFPKIGLWPRAYVLTFNKEPLFPGEDPKNMCVVDRLQMLSFSSGNTTLTPPRILCAASLFGRLAQFDFQAWTPLSAPVALPPLSTESAGAAGPGAVFFRPLDDELHLGAHTPTVDFIQVEHWSNINWTAATVSIQRYTIPIDDFDSSYGGCVAVDECIPTPGGQRLDPVREVFSAIKYSAESAVGAFTSHANGTAVARVRWFELRWEAPIVGQPKQWRLFQEGALPWGDGVHRWLGAADMDANGTILLSYAASSTLLYPSLYATSRLRNDPPSQMRGGLLLAGGAVGSVVAGKRWGDYASVSADPSEARTFYVTGQRSDTVDPWVVRLSKVRVRGETVQRVWQALDACANSATCTQWITTE